MEFYNFKKKLEERVILIDKMSKKKLNKVEKLINSELSSKISGSEIVLKNYCLKLQQMK